MRYREIIKLIEDSSMEDGSNRSEQLIGNPNVLAVDISNYELSKLVQEYPNNGISYGKAGTKALIMFYTEEEKQKFEKDLRSKGISFENIVSAGGASELADTNTKSHVIQYKPTRISK